MYVYMRLGEKRFKAGAFLDFRALGIFPQAVLISPPSIGYLFHWFVELWMCLAIGYEVSGIWYCFFHILCN